MPNKLWLIYNGGKYMVVFFALKTDQSIIHTVSYIWDITVYNTVLLKVPALTKD